MKKLLFFVFVIFYISNVEAQRNKGDLIKLDLGIFNKLRVGYEHPVSDAFSAGGNANFYYGSFPGFKIEPFGRYYFGSECPSGLYAQARFLFGIFNKEFIYYRLGDELDISFAKKTSLTSMGGGLDLGYQWLSGKDKNIVIDLSLGVQVMQDLNNSIVQNGAKYSTANVSYLSIGPGAIFNPHLMIGYRF